MGRVGDRSSWRRRVARLAMGAATLYLALVAMLALIQRRLIYFPAKVAAIDASSAELDGAAARTVRVTTTDGLTLAGWLVSPDHPPGTSPAGASGEGASEDALHGAASRDLVIYFPGNAGNRLQRAPICNLFATLGADVLLVDYRGYGENRGAPSEAGLYRDARAVWEFAVNELRRSPDRIYLYGESIGGAVAIELADELQRRAPQRVPAGLLLQGAFDSLVETAVYHYPWLPVRWLLRDRFPSVERIGRLPCRLVHLHGRLDRVVPLERGRTLFRSAPERSADGFVNRFVELPHRGHNDISLDEIGRAFESLRRR